MPGFDYVEPLMAGEGGVRGEAVVEEGFDSCCLWGGGVFGYEADESTWAQLERST